MHPLLFNSSISSIIQDFKFAISLTIFLLPTNCKSTSHCGGSKITEDIRPKSISYTFVYMEFVQLYIEKVSLYLTGYTEIQGKYKAKEGNLGR